MTLMKNGNILDIGIATVRKSCLTNMFDRKAVQYYANDFGFCELVVFLEEITPGEYMTFIDSIDYDNVPTMDDYDIDEFKEYPNSSAARQRVMEDFEDEVMEYREVRQKLELGQLPFSYDDWLKINEDGKTNFKNYVFKTIQEHLYNYYFPLNNKLVFWLQDGFYEYEAGDLSPLSGKTWVSAQSQSGRLNEMSKRKFIEIDEQMRFNVLLENE